MRFNERLKAIRKENNLTQKDIYTRLNVSANCYASYEQGRTEPNIEMLKQICQCLDVSADYLLGLEDETGQKTYSVKNLCYNSGTHNGNVNFDK